jgi:hypothetical protein
MLSVPADATELKVTVPISDFYNFAAFLASLPRLEKLFLFTVDLAERIARNPWILFVRLSN